MAKKEVMTTLKTESDYEEIDKDEVEKIKNRFKKSKGGKK